VSEEIDRLKKILRAGMRGSKQTSYDRGEPARKSLADLVEARAGLKRYVESAPKDTEGWRLLSLAHECCLDYSSARRCLERAMELSGKRDRKDLKRLALLREGEQKR